MQMSEEKLYTPEDLSQILQLSKYTIYEMIKRGDIPVHRISRSIRISKSQLESYLSGTTKTDNIFVADIVQENGEKFALVDSVKICVSTPLYGSIKVSISPEDIILSPAEFVSSARNMLKGTVSNIKEHNGVVVVTVDVGIKLNSLITKNSLEKMDIRIGNTIYAIFKTMSVRVGI